MREIKFRAWDKDTKHMLFPNYSLKDLTTKHYNFEKNLIWMQFTGLKDKNEKDIYEGDILQYDELNYTNKERKKVYWLNGTFMVGGQRITECQLSHLWRIIGNIYENPELLKQDD